MAMRMTNYLNYIWISNRTYYDPDGHLSRSPIPAEYLNNVFKQSEKNPQLQTLVWCDYRFLQEREKDYLERVSKVHPSIQFKDLNEIPSYWKDSLFRAPIRHKADIWEKSRFGEIVGFASCVRCLSSGGRHLQRFGYYKSGNSP